MGETIKPAKARAIEKLSPNDPRVQHCYADISGHRWHYLDAAARGRQRGVVVLVHGFPDLSFGWRYQIPMLTELGLRCIAIDCMGYGETGTSSNLHDFGFRAHADAIAAISAQIGATSIVLGGHDWGGATVYRVAQWRPRLVSHVFSVCTPYFPVADTFVSTEELARGPLPQFGYQLQFGSEDGIIERVTGDEGCVRKFLNGLYGGKTPSRKPFMTPESGVDLSLFSEGEEVQDSVLLSREELDFYVSQYAKRGLDGPCNWYRTRKVNFDDELELPSEQRSGVRQPTLFIAAKADNILKPEMARGMAKAIPNITFGEVNAGHWALWQTPKETNQIISDWIRDVVFDGKSKI